MFLEKSLSGVFFYVNTIRELYEWCLLAAGGYGLRAQSFRAFTKSIYVCFAL